MWIHCRIDLLDFFAKSNGIFSCIEVVILLVREMMVARLHEHKSINKFFLGAKKCARVP